MRPKLNLYSDYIDDAEGTGSREMPGAPGVLPATVEAQLGGCEGVAAAATRWSYSHDIVQLRRCYASVEETAHCRAIQ